jgi:ATP-binding cassette subfamily B protein
LKSPQPKEPEASHFRLILRLLGLAWRYRWGCFQTLASQLLLLALGMVGIALAGLGIDTLRHAVDPATRPPEWPAFLQPPAHWSPLTTLTSVAAAILGLALLRLGLGYLNGVWFGELLQGRLVVDLRAQCYDKLQRLSFSFFDSNTGSSLINRIGGDIQWTRLFIDGVLFQVILLVVSVAASLGYMLSIHVRLTLACLATTPLVWIASALFSRTVKPAYKESSDLNDKLVQRLAESIRGMRVIKAFSREAAELERFEKANRSLRDQQRWIFKRVSLFVPAILFLSQANILVLLAYGGTLAVRGEIGIGTGLVAFAAILQQFSGQLAGIGNIANTAQQCLRAAARVFEILDTPIHIESPAQPVQLPNLRGGLRFENVCFDYGKEPVLQDLCFEVQPGQCVAIVGPVGSGKSTLLSLIPRFYDPTAGSIQLDGVDLRQLELSTLRKKVGLVFQESFLFSTTIAANIAFGKPDATAEQIERAARIASAHEFITALPEGYDTILGEAGVGLSGGQKQRLALARAILLDPALLLLDDPTAAVDPETEHEIASAMESAMQGRTTFIVAHRPGMLQRASLILVLNRGRIVQSGTHESLLREPGYYRDTVLLQTAEIEPPSTAPVSELLPI